MFITVSFVLKCNAEGNANNSRISIFQSVNAIINRPAHLKKTREREKASPHPPSSDVLNAYRDIYAQADYNCCYDNYSEVLRDKLLIYAH